MITARAYDTHMDQLFERIKRLHAALDSAGIEYRVVGGLAVFFQVSMRKPGRGRSTEDVDIAIDRKELSRIADAAEKFGFRYRHVAGVDMLVDAETPRASTAVQLVFINEKVRPEYLEAVPGFSQPTRTAEGILLAPVADLVKMKLTSFRMKDQLHLKDLDSARLITPEIEASLPEILRARLAAVRATR
jgi:signal recognition particle subunit SEC65